MILIMISSLAIDTISREYPSSDSVNRIHLWMDEENAEYISSISKQLTEKTKQVHYAITLPFRADLHWEMTSGPW